MKHLEPAIAGFIMLVLLVLALGSTSTAANPADNDGFKPGMIVRTNYICTPMGIGQITNAASTDVKQLPQVFIAMIENGMCYSGGDYVDVEVVAVVGRMVDSDGNRIEVLHIKPANNPDSTVRAFIVLPVSSLGQPV